MPGPVQKTPQTPLTDGPTAGEAGSGSSRDRLVLYAILAVALFLRLGFVFLYPDAPLKGDQINYLRGASELLAGETYTGTRGPAYSAFIAFCQMLGGDSLLAPRVGNAALGTATVLALFCLCRRLFGTRVALLTAALWAVHPRNATFSIYLFSEHAYTLCAILATDLLSRACSSPGRRSVLLAGLVFGVGILTREMLLIALLPSCAALIACSTRGRRESWIRALLLLVVAIGVVAPWTARNYVVHERWIPVGFSSGIPLFEGNYKAKSLREARAARNRIYGRIFKESGRSRLIADDKIKSMSWRMIRERQPEWIFEKLASNGPRLFQPELTHPELWTFVAEPEAAGALRRTYVVLFLLFHGLILILGCVGLAHWPKGGTYLFPLFFLVFCFTAHVVTQSGISRYHITYEWVLFLGSGATLSLGLPEQRWRRVLAAILVVMLLISQAPVKERWVKPYRGNPEFSAER